ncbi:MAG: ankyrin repeat domain-containing protein [Chlamydiales bacterium]|nr:ankyrin repeat domain-containing protein [Chlamydiales bacterium]
MKIGTSPLVFSPLNSGETLAAACLMFMAVTAVYFNNKRNSEIAERNSAIADGNEKIRDTFEGYCKKYQILSEVDFRIANIRDLLLKTSVLGDKRFFDDPALVEALTSQYRLEEVLAANAERKSAIQVVCQHNQSEALETLLKAIDGMDLLAQKDSDGNTPLHVAVINKSKEVVEVFAGHDSARELFLLQDSAGDTPLHLICRKNQNELFSNLSKHESFENWLNAKNHEGQTPRQIIDQSGSQAMKQALTIYNLPNMKAQ